MSQEGIPNLPTFSYSQQVDKKGNLTTEALLYEDESNQTLNQALTLLNLSVASTVINDGSQNRGTIVSNGLLAPQKTTAEITTLEPDVPIGTIWFDTDVAKLKVKTAAGVVETITST